MLYFAYGSNMDETQMNVRCPGATVAGVALLEGYAFIINGRGVATVIRCDGSTVYGTVWNVTESCIRSLDHYEGVRHNLYAKEDMSVRTADGTEHTAFTYVATNTEQGRPETRYMERIIKGAENHALPEAYVRGLRTWLETPG